MSLFTRYRPLVSFFSKAGMSLTKGLIKQRAPLENLQALFFQMLFYDETTSFKTLLIKSEKLCLLLRLWPRNDNVIYKATSSKCQLVDCSFSDYVVNVLCNVVGMNEFLKLKLANE